jgi:hypothetical protein
VYVGSFVPVATHLAAAGANAPPTLTLPAPSPSPSTTPAPAAGATAEEGAEAGQTPSTATTPSTVSIRASSQVRLEAHPTRVPCCCSNVAGVPLQALIPGVAEESDLLQPGAVVVGVSGVCVIGMSRDQVRCRAAPSYEMPR